MTPHDEGRCAHAVGEWRCALAMRSFRTRRELCGHRVDALLPRRHVGSSRLDSIGAPPLPCAFMPATTTLFGALRCARTLGITVTGLALLLAGCPRKEAPSTTEGATTTSATPSIATASAPQTYHDDEGRFEITMPVAPKIEQQPGSTFSDAMHAATATPPGGGNEVRVLWFDFRDPSMVNVAGAFDGGQNNMCKQDELLVQSQREFTFPGGFPARDTMATSKTAEPWKDMMRFVYADGRVYIVVVRDVRDDAKAQSYIDSFKLFPRAK
jgi:hypothetical protein